MSLSLKINKRAIFAVICVVFLYLSLIDGLPLGTYIDDIVPLLFGLMWIKSLFENKKATLEKKVFFCLIIVCALGILSNLISGVVTDIKLIALDLYSFLKIFLVYLGTNAIFKNKEKAQIYTVKYLSKIAKIYICFAFIFGMLNYLGIVNMSQQVRFGINTFCFIYSNASQFGILAAVALGFIIYSEDKHLKFYEIIGLCVLLMTLKGMSLIIFAVYLAMNFFRTRKVKTWHIIFIGIILFIALRYQIYTYLIDNTAPRAVLLKYGFITANNYFPLGAGFGTYGSDVAGRYYSPLYSQYGFSARTAFLYGEKTALNDAYLAMLLGQFGYIGTIVTYIAFALIGIKIFKSDRKNYKAFYITVAFFVCILGLSIMAGSLKGTIGELMMFSIQLYCLSAKRGEI